MLKLFIFTVVKTENLAFNNITHGTPSSRFVLILFKLHKIW